MTNTGAANLSAYTPAQSAAAAQAVSTPGETTAIQAKKTERRRPRTVPQLPQARLSDYRGRVSTFYCASTEKYSETYEPVRKTSLGEVWRIESRLVNGRWLHIPYSLKGDVLRGPEELGGLIGDGELSLIFDPVGEKQFALAIFAVRPKSEFVRLGDEVTVYRSRKDQSMGIVREFVGRV